MSNRSLQAVFFVCLICLAANAQQVTSEFERRGNKQPDVMLASLRPQPQLIWQRVSPTPQQPDGPVLYQLLFSTGGTPGTLAKFDTNPRHLTNSLVSESGSTVIINGTANMTGFQLTTGAGAGKVLTSDGSGIGTWQTGGTGTVTSVGLTAPGSDFSVSGSPVTGSGTLGLNWTVAPNSANTANAIVKRDGTGSFNAGAISASSTISSLNPAGSSIAIIGHSSATTGFGIGVDGVSDSASGTAGVFNNTLGGKILSLQNNGGEVVSVAGNGVVNASGNVASNGMIKGINSNASGMGVSGSGNFGVYGQSGTSFSLGLTGNAAVWGDGRTGTTYGVVGTSTGNTGTGTAGLSDSGTGVLGKSNTGLGIFGTSNSVSGTAAVFDNLAGGDILLAQNNGFIKFRVAGNGTIQAQTSSAQLLMGDPGCGPNFYGIGIAGLSGCNNYALVGDNVGNTFINFSGSGHSLHLRSNNGDRMTIDDAGNVNIANLVGTNIFSISATGTVKIPFDLQVTGNVSKGSGSFKIDHPLDPANKYLYHSFVESPDMMDIYNGNVTTNARGLVTITLPDYFDALNRDFRYQLTVIGQFAQAIVARKINNNRFTIRTNRPNVEVSWQVTGIRQDAYANTHRIPVEEDKGEQRGTYLHPELFGQPASKQAVGQMHQTANVPKSGGQ